MMDKGFEKWIKSLPLDFIQHMWEFYQEDLHGDMVPMTVYKVVPERLTETDVFNIALELGLNTKQALEVLEWKPRSK